MQAGGADGGNIKQAGLVGAVKASVHGLFVGGGCVGCGGWSALLHHLTEATFTMICTSLINL